MFTEPPAFFFGIVVETEIFVSRSEKPQSVAGLVDKTDVFVVPFQAFFEIFFVRGQPGIVLYYLQMRFPVFHSRILDVDKMYKCRFITYKVTTI